MPVRATRKLRNVCAVLMMLSGLSHTAQLWLLDIDLNTLIGALLGLFYFLIALGLAGRSRFSLWLGVLMPAFGVFGATVRYLTLHEQPVTLLHVTIDTLVLLFCLYILFKTRHAEME